MDISARLFVPIAIWVGSNMSLGLRSLKPLTSPDSAP